MRLSAFDAGTVNAMLGEMAREARQSWRRARRPRRSSERRLVECATSARATRSPSTCRLRDLTDDDSVLLRELFEARYAEMFGRAVPGVEVEILTWSVTMSASVGGTTGNPPVPRELAAGARPSSAGCSMA